MKVAASASYKNTDNTFGQGTQSAVSSFISGRDANGNTHKISFKVNYKIDVTPLALAAPLAPIQQQSPPTTTTITPIPQ